MKSRLHIIRHGITEGNQKNWHYGKSDIPLAPEGIENIRALKAQNIYPEINGRYFTSGMKRTDETLNLIYGNVEKVHIDNLKEINFGEFEKKTYEELKNDRRYIEWIEDEIGDIMLPKGESRNQFKTRVLKGFEELINFHRTEELKYRHKEDIPESLCVCHGGVIGCIMAVIFEREKKEFVHWIPSPARGFTIFLEDGKVIGYKAL